LKSCRKSRFQRLYDASAHDSVIAIREVAAVVAAAATDRVSETLSMIARESVPVRLRRNRRLPRLLRPLRKLAAKVKRSADAEGAAAASPQARAPRRLRVESEGTGVTK
jgi:hypothetical protein